MTDLEIITLIGVIVGIVTAILYFRSYQLKRREREQPVIIDIINHFVNPTIAGLVLDRYDSREFDFPRSLNLTYGISTDDSAFERFSKRKHFLTWNISRYNKFCKKIDSKIGSLKARAMISHIITTFVDANGVQFELTEQYENYSNEQLIELLEEDNLIETIKEIKELQRLLPSKVTKLITQLSNVKDGWKEQYNIV